jgi:hypothetical protein
VFATLKQFIATAPEKLTKRHHVITMMMALPLVLVMRLMAVLVVLGWGTIP